MPAFFFSPLGRLPRDEFTLGWLFWLSLELACVLGFLASEPATPAHSYWFLMGMAVSGLSAVSVVILGMKRLRDAGFPAWAALVLIVPFVSLMALVVMSYLPSRPNKMD
jgi:uncharacterized membrane protein YhaH (DUF805 family)